MVFSIHRPLGPRFPQRGYRIKPTRNQNTRFFANRNTGGGRRGKALFAIKTHEGCVWGGREKSEMLQLWERLATLQHHVSRCIPDLPPGLGLVGLHALYALSIANKISPEKCKHGPWP